MTDRHVIADRFRELQDSICAGLEQMDGKARFHEDKWEREGGGGGRTRVIQEGDVLEKGCVNFSAVHGALPGLLYKELELDPKRKLEFFATGVSIVMHTCHPMVPIIHMNVRYFEVNENGSMVTAWFGGGIDLTPHYIFPDDAAWFHKELKKVCDRHDARFYPEFKKWADEYFFIRHRNETRGVGGVFFDKMQPGKERSLDQCLAFVLELGNSFAPTYSTIVNKNRKKPFTETHKKWQLLRRGRYVEFNLVYDRGTRFGLETNGRTESILLSLPKNASWEYDYHPPEGSQEKATLDLLKMGIDWTQNQGPGVISDTF